MTSGAWWTSKKNLCIRKLCPEIRIVVISAKAFVHPGAEIVDSILMPGVHVGRGSRIRRAILDENVCVPAGIRVGYGDVEDEYFTRTPNGVVVVPATVGAVYDRAYLLDRTKYARS